MNVPSECLSDYEALPPALRGLLDAELEAGNAVTDVGHSHPAPPVGAWFLLARPVTTRARESGDGLAFYARNSSQYSGEFTTEKRHHFILEPPLPPPEPIDMDALRAEREAGQRAADAARCETIQTEAAAACGKPPVFSEMTHELPLGLPAGPDRVARFRASMEIDYERWKEGTGYEVALIAEATPDERAAIETMLVCRGVGNWRDVEALVALDTPRARAALRDTLAGGSEEFAIAVVRRAPHLVSDDERTAVIVAALAGTDFYHGLSDALAEVEAFHPPEVIAALLRGVLRAESGKAVHFAALLMFLHGKAGSAFDWEQRPYFLKFHTADADERIEHFRDLCGRIGVDPGRFVIP